MPTHQDLAFRHGVALNTASSAMRLLKAEKRREARARQALAERLLPIRASASSHAVSMHLWLDLLRKMVAADLVYRVAVLGVKITPARPLGSALRPTACD